VLQIQHLQLGAALNPRQASGNRQSENLNRGGEAIELVVAAAQYIKVAQVANSWKGAVSSVFISSEEVPSGS
jgi:hypothetical protein